MLPLLSQIHTVLPALGLYVHKSAFVESGVETKWFRPGCYKQSDTGASPTSASSDLELTTPSNTLWIPTLLHHDSKVTDEPRRATPGPASPKPTFLCTRACPLYLPPQIRLKATHTSITALPTSMCVFEEGEGSPESMSHCLIRLTTCQEKKYTSCSPEI